MPGSFFLPVELSLFCCYTPPVMLWRVHSRWLLALLLVAFVALLPRPVQAVGADSMEVHVDPQVIHCTARIQIERQAITMALKDGIVATTVWHFQVAMLREYWLNKGVADIAVSRRVEPDLLSRSWLLFDDASGISRRVYVLDDAISFLTDIEQFPVLDSSLLVAGVPYRMTIRVEVYHGEIKEAWWSGIWHPAQAVLQQDFKLQ